MKRTLVFLIAFLCCFCFAGCFDSVKTSTSEKLQTKAADNSVWDFYYQFDNANEEIKRSVLEQKTTDSFDLYSQFENEYFFNSAIRNGAAVIDVFNKDEEIALFEFSNLYNYQIKEITAGKTYTVTYEDKFSRNTNLDFDNEIDGYIFNIGLINVNTISISKTDSKTYRLSISQKISLPDEVQAINDVSEDEQGNTIEKNRVVTSTEASNGSQTYTRTTVVASKNVKSKSGSILNSYTRTSDFYEDGNGRYLQETININGQVTQRKYRLNNAYTLNIKYDDQIGNFVYDVSYRSNGSATIYGEIYYQGAGKYLHKRYTKINQGPVFGIIQSNVFECKISNDSYFFKVYPVTESYEYLNIREQNLKLFAMVKAGEKSVCVSYNKNKFELKDNN